LHEAKDRGDALLQELQKLIEELLHGPGLLGRWVTVEWMWRKGSIAALGATTSQAPVQH
jgi:hypothetical protein